MTAPGGPDVRGVGVPEITQYVCTPPGQRAGRVDVCDQRAQQRQRRIMGQVRPGGAPRREHVDGLLGPPDLTEIDGLVPGTARWSPARR